MKKIIVFPRWSKLAYGSAYHAVDSFYEEHAKAFRIVEIAVNVSLVAAAIGILIACSMAGMR